MISNKSHPKPKYIIDFFELGINWNKASLYAALSIKTKWFE